MLRITGPLLLALLSPAVQASAADSYAVLAVADAPAGPDAELAELTRLVRAALRDRVAGVLDAPEMRTRFLGEAGLASLAELDRAFAAADRAFDDAEFGASSRALRVLLADLERQPDSAEVHAQRVRALARLAYVEKVLKNASAMAALLERLVALEPSYVADPVQYPPSYAKELEAARQRVGALPKARLTVRASGGSAVEVFVNGKPVGSAPIALSLPPGRYVVAGVSGGLRVPPLALDLAREPRSVELDAALAHALRAEAGPGLAAAAEERAARVARTGAWLGATRAVAVSKLREGGESFLGAALYDVERGAPVREGRIHVQSGSPASASLDALAAFLLTGQLSREVTPLSPKLDLSPSPAAVGVASVVAPPPRARAWMRPAAYGAGAVALGLAGFAVYEGISARNDFRAANALPGPDGIFVSASDKAAYDRHRASGSREERAAYVSAASAALFAVGAGVLGYLSWDRGAPVVRF